MDSSLWQAQAKVKVYIRNYKKNAIVMIIEAPITSRELKEKIEEKFRKQVPECALFYKGRRIDDTQTLIALQASTIIHLVNIQRTIVPQLKLTFKVRKNLKEPKHPDNIAIKVKISSRAYIRDVMESDIKTATGKGETEVFFVYLGKPLNVFKRFYEELVQNEAEILVVDFKREEVLDHTRVERKASVRGTVYNYAPPGMFNRPFQDHEQLQSSTKANMLKKTSQNFQFAPSEQMGGSTAFFKGKKMFQPIAPSPSLEFKPVDVFDPHIQAAPNQKLRTKGQTVKYEGNLKEIDNNTAPLQNPEKGGPMLKADDFIFAGDPLLEETQNLLGGAVQEIKENFMKKNKSQSSSEHSKG